MNRLLTGSPLKMHYPHTIIILNVTNASFHTLRMHHPFAIIMLNVIYAIFGTLTYIRI